MNIQNTNLPGVAAARDPLESEPHNETVFDFQDLLRIIRIRLRIIVGVAMLVTAFAGLLIYRITPIYTGNVLVLLDQRQNKVVDINAILSGLPTDPSSIENQVQILRSRSLMLRVIDKLNLNRDPEFSPELIPTPAPTTDVFSALNPARWVEGFNSLGWFNQGLPPSTIEQRALAARNGVIDRIIGRLTVSAQGRSTAIQISFESTSATKAAQISNAIADAYVDDQLNAKFEATQTTSKWLGDQIQQLSAQAQAAENAVQQYKAKYHLAETGTGSGTVVQQQLAQVNGQLIVARSELAEQEAKYARMSELQKTGRSTDVSEVVASPVVAQLRSQEAELQRQAAELSSRYGPRHPKILDIESQQSNLNVKIDQEVQRVVETVSSAVLIARARVKSLEDSLAELGKTSSDENQTKVRLSELESQATSSRSLYETFLSKSKETQGQEDIQTPDARVISRAEVPRSPSYPNKILTLAVAVPAGFLLGFLLALLIERLDAGFRTGLQTERLLGLPVLAIVPEVRKLKRNEASAADRVIQNPLSAYAEAIRGLQMSLVLSNVDESPKVVLVTSAVPSEGKTTVAVSLARQAARSGKKVILLDCDMRHPGVGTLIIKAAKSFERGLIQVLSGEAPCERCWIKDPLSDVLVLPAAGKIASPPDLLASVAMERLIKNLRSDYDLVIIDSAPLLPVNDSKILAKLVDKVIFVIRWEKTPRAVAIEATRALLNIDAPIAGVVLARADQKRQHYYSHGYATYRSYKKYYADA